MYTHVCMCAHIYNILFHIPRVFPVYFAVLGAALGAQRPSLLKAYNAEVNLNTDQRGAHSVPLRKDCHNDFPLHLLS